MLIKIYINPNSSIRVHPFLSLMQTIPGSRAISAFTMRRMPYLAALCNAVLPFFLTIIIELTSTSNIAFTTSKWSPIAAKYRGLVLEESHNVQTSGQVLKISLTISGQRLTIKHIRIQILKFMTNLINLKAYSIERIKSTSNKAYL